MPPSIQMSPPSPLPPSKEPNIQCETILALAALQFSLLSDSSSNALHHKCLSKNRKMLPNLVAFNEETPLTKQ